eukprot:13549677-Alexandrium_andersonii.AAC.1
MSASLVGSEMCIRDRRLIYEASCGCGRPRETQTEPTETGRDARAGGVAVSYTHLTLPTICSV